MDEVFWAWGISAAVIALIAVWLGKRSLAATWWGVIVDRRLRCSLTQLQLVLWTLVILSLVSGVFFGRLVDGVDDPLDFEIPDEVLLLLGVSFGSTGLAGR